MQRWMSLAKPCPNLTSKTEETTYSIRCGKWVLRATKIRRNRAQDPSPVKKQPTSLTKKQLTTPMKKRKRYASPTSSANSVVGENNVQADCVGAIDGTHIQAAVPNEMETAFRGRKGTKTQNVMVVCSFDMKFTFVYLGWEGSAHDGRVFLAAVTNPAFMFPHPPVNKYYVVDSAYTNMLGYLAPYKGQRYHKDEWNGVNTVFASPMELFNYKHSSLRNVIERCIGVFKARFPILKSMPSYSPARQPSIVMACCVVHNMIVIHHGRDEFFDDYDSDGEWEGDNGSDDGDASQVEHVNTSRQSVEMMGNRRDQMAMEMWEAY